ncbi:sulfite oxidase cytochrome subunit [Pedobacter sp. BAL39]|uniref:c-type cytochrome n=1 Tax=Pedobacter sp. BAL39 TaxID=391596 RepID=UPI000155A06E|nr:cytochrome c [Pedobacter sp. BAL39]EDM35561.1 sulfite oxidase cytochrome subunit [Pedobacter sp. BAL39]
MDKSSVFKGYLIAIAALGAAIAIALYAFLRDPQEETPDKFGFGKVAGADRIKALDIDVMPDGRGLPAGTGDIRQGLIIYTEKCVSCHGNGEKVDYKLPGDALFVNQPAKKTKTIGTYWPYATTIFDYIRRAMPYNAPGSLSDQEVYHLTAYLLYANKVIPANTVINEHSLPKIVMPAKKNYVVDDREGGSDIR